MSDEPEQRSGRERRQRHFPEGDDVQCSFCGKSHKLVKIAVGPEGAAICNECVALVTEAFLDELGERHRDSPHPALRRVQERKWTSPDERGGFG